MIRRFLLLVSLLTASSALAQVTLPERAREAAGAIDAPRLESTVRVLSSDLFEGRGPGSRGDELTRLYLANELRELGLQPGGPGGSWEQRFEMVGIRTVAPATLGFSSKGGTVDLKFRDEYIGASGVQNSSVNLQGAELVFVGYGIDAPEYQWDDFKGTDVKGKILVVMNNDPDWDPTLFEGNRRLYYGRWSYKYENAARHGAAGVFIIHTTPSAGYPWQVVQTSWGGEQFELPDEGEKRVSLKGWMTEDAARKLLASAGHDLAKLTESARNRTFKPVPLGITTSISLSNEIKKVTTANVLGLLPGSDPSLREEVVVYSAHHDHLGMGEPDKSGDRIYNGALDNATGCAVLLAIAKAYKALPVAPKRSILFAFVAAEEQGLLGSKYFAEHPTFHPGRIAANINYDSPNILGRTRDVVFLGYRKSTLDAVAEGVAAMQGRSVKGDQFPDRGSYYRSDQFNFAKIGVPAMYVRPGTDYVGRPEGWAKEQVEAYEAVRYHQPSDEMNEQWTFDGMIEDAQLGFYSGLTVANAAEMPRWNVGDEFEAARKKALAEVASNTAAGAKGK